MAENSKLIHPWLVAVWPGMGHVALNAGVYLLAKLEMNLIAEFETNDLFDVDNVEVRDGLIQKTKRPRSRLFVWKDPKGKHDLVVFLGEAQPPIGKYAFCRQLIDHARQLGVERVFTFAAMATQMRPGNISRVFGAATGREGLEDLKRLELHVLENGHIGGLNGVLLAAAAEADLPGACLLGEMPHIITHLPFPKASLAILEAFATIARFDLDLTELVEQARVTDEELVKLLSRVEQKDETSEQAEDEAGDREIPEEEDRVGAAERQRIEHLFAQAGKDRSKAFELKQELDRFGVFKEYEDRFLGLFKKSE